jgi:hypothetical protein
MSRPLRRRLAALGRHLRGIFGRDLSNQPTSQDDAQEWFFEPVKDIDAQRGKLANGQALARAAHGDERHELLVGMAALLGIKNRETLNWIVTRMLASSDPPMHSLARGLKAMWDPDKQGRSGALDRDLQLACLLHIEILTMRASGLEEDTMRDRAADIVLGRLKGLSPETAPHVRTRLMEIYRANEARVQEIWLEMQDFGFTHLVT